MNQPWFCETCGVRGAVTHERRADVLVVVDAIRAQHEEIAPGCGVDVRQIRVVNRHEQKAREP